MLQWYVKCMPLTALLQPTKILPDNTLDKYFLRFVAYRSKRLTPTERRDAQIPKKFRAIKLERWLLGKSDVTVDTDHQYFNSFSTGTWQPPPSTFKEITLLLQRCNFAAVYKRGSSLHWHFNTFQLFITLTAMLDSTSPRAKALRPDMQVLEYNITHGRAPTKEQLLAQLLSFWHFWDQLSVADGALNSQVSPSNRATKHTAQDPSISQWL